MLESAMHCYSLEWAVGGPSPGKGKPLQTAEEARAQSVARRAQDLDGPPPH